MTELLLPDIAADVPPEGLPIGRAAEASAATIRRAHAVHPLAAVQSEFSLFARDVLRNGEEDAMDESGIGPVAFSPPGRGCLTGGIRTVDDLAPEDARRGLPRFRPEAIEANLRLVERLRAVAEEKGATPAQVALAWVAGQGVVPVPGTRRRSRLDENVASLRVELTGDERARLAEACRRMRRSPVGETRWAFPRGPAGSAPGDAGAGAAAGGRPGAAPWPTRDPGQEPRSQSS